MICFMNWFSYKKLSSQGMPEMKYSSKCSHCIPKSHWIMGYALSSLLMNSIYYYFVEDLLYVSSSGLYFYEEIFIFHLWKSILLSIFIEFYILHCFEYTIVTFLLYLHVFVYLFIYFYMVCMCQGMRVEVRRQLAGVSLSHDVFRISSDCHAWQLVPFPTRSSYWSIHFLSETLLLRS